MKEISVPNVDVYIAGFPPEVQEQLILLREAIRVSAPEAEEVISYQMPAYKLYGMLVYFAAYPKHIGFYPGSSGIGNFKKELANYKTSKGTVQFPVGETLPISLISEIVKFRAAENLEKVQAKKLKKSASAK